MSEHGRLGPIEWAAARRPRPGETVCGDQSIAADVAGSAALFGVTDGLGHGQPAAAASQCAVEVLSRARTKPLDSLIQICHRALADTRGAAITLARFDFDEDTLSWIGIGNVTANVVTKRPTGVEVRASAPLVRGIVGYRMPGTPAPKQVSIGPGDLLVITTDGIAENHLDSIDFAAPAVAISEQILQKHSKETDDALVLAARHRGSSA